MRINPTTNLGISSSLTKQMQAPAKKVAAGTISFRNYNPAGARRIEEELARKGITCDFRSNEFVGKCVQKVVNVFEELFGKSWLPDKVTMESLTDDALAAYNYINNKVTIDYRRNNGCYDNIDNLKEQAKNNHHYIKPNWASSLHPAHVFVHELAHCAHWHHLQERNGFSKASDVWYGLVGGVPTAIGRLITRYKISNYAVEAKDMCEFMAEKMAQDICGGLTNNTWNKYRDIDVDYSNIFNRKWNYRYSSPQSYIDYFTQQVWNGDIDEARRAGDAAERYLAELDAVKVAPTIQTLEKGTEGIPLLGSIGKFLPG